MGMYRSGHVLCYQVIVFFYSVFVVTENKLSLSLSYEDVNMSE